MGVTPPTPRSSSDPSGASTFEVNDAAREAEILAAVAGVDPWDAAVHLALGLGLRREEVLGLRWCDVDDAVARPPDAHGRGRRVPLRAAQERVPGAATSRCPPSCDRAFRRHRLDQSERLLGLGIRPELVVCNPIGEPFQPATFSGMWKDFAEAHGFEEITCRGLRHGAATLLLAAGCPDTVACERWATPTRGLARYQDVVERTPAGRGRRGWMRSSAVNRGRKRPQPERVLRRLRRSRISKSSHRSSTPGLLPSCPRPLLLGVGSLASPPLPGRTRRRARGVTQENRRPAPALERAMIAR